MKIATTVPNEPHGPSIAIAVDDLVTWVVAGLQPTGIQRVVVGILDAAAARPNLGVWPAMSLGGLVPSDDVRLVMVDRSRLVWGDAAQSASLRLRSLRKVRAVVQRQSLPPSVRRLAKRVYGRLALAMGRMEAEDAPSSSIPDLLLVPGGFWTGDAADRLVALAEHGVRLRVVIYDLFPVRNPEWCVPELRQDFARAVDAVLPVCDRVVTLCEEVATQVAERYPEVRERLQVGVPTLQAHAPQASVAGLEPKLTGIGKPFVLALSTVEPRKNHRVILDAWRKVRNDLRLDGAWLVVAGRRGWMAEDIETEIARDGGDLNILRLDHITDDQVDALYQACHATVHASWAEGFGLPARESVARGIPTFMSATIPRDGLPAGSFRVFDPTDADGLATMMTDALLGPRTRYPVDLGGGNGWEPVLSALVD